MSLVIGLGNYIVSLMINHITLMSSVLQYAGVCMYGMIVNIIYNIKLVFCSVFGYNLMFLDLEEFLQLFFTH